MHSNVSLMATAYQPDFNNPALHLNIYPRGLSNRRDHVYRMRVASKHITPDGVLEVTLESTYGRTDILKGKRPDVIRAVFKLDTEGKTVRKIRVTIVGILARTFEVSVHNKPAPSALAPVVFTVASMPRVAAMDVANLRMVALTCGWFNTTSRKKPPSFLLGGFPLLRHALKGRS
ncbi:MAG: hypothetical protein CMF62_12990 [Magnetococcales bacterium]|nr:hypothetical protein [Magnetococcales bacterium]